MALLPPNTGGGSGVVTHNELFGRDQPNAHPITAITGLQDRLDAMGAATATTEALRYFYTFTNTTSQDINMMAPLDTISAVVAVVRVSDGAMIEPEITYTYDTGPARYISRIRLGFSPPVSGQFVVHIVR